VVAVLAALSSAQNKSKKLVPKERIKRVVPEFTRLIIAPSAPKQVKRKPSESS